MKVPTRQGFYVYILKCKDQTYYCGWTNDLEKRIKIHNEGKGAKYTRGRRPCCLVYFESLRTKSEALQREYAIKQLSRKDKVLLIKTFMVNCNKKCDTFK